MWDRFFEILLDFNSADSNGDLHEDIRLAAKPYGLREINNLDKCK